MTSVIATAGLERIRALVAGDATHVAVGSNATAPSIADIALGVEEARVAAETLEFGVKFQARGFFTNAELPATTREVGVFLNGTATPNSGSLLAHELLEFAKNSSDLLVIVEFEISAG